MHREKGTVEGYLRLVAKNGEDRTWYYRNFHYEEPGRAPYMIGHAENISGILQAFCRSARRANASAISAATGNKSRLTSASTPKPNSATASVQNAATVFILDLILPTRSVEEFFYTERKRVAGFVSIDCRLVLKREPDFVQSFQQALTYEWVNCEPGAQTLRVANLTVFQIDRELIGFVSLRAPQ